MTRLSRRLLEKPGAFAWWYVDAVDANGDGLVLIWSFGLPFLPGYRASSGARPGGWPSLNVAVYEGGQPSFYLLQRYAPEDAEWGDEAWRFGDTRITRTVGDRVSIHAEIDAPLPSGDRLTGVVDLEGVRRAGGAEAAGSVQHDWSPLTGPCALRAELRAGDWRAHIEGRGYHDRNGGEVGLWELGIERWLWGRAPLPDEDRIYYVVFPEDGPPRGVGVVTRADGETTEREITLETEPGLSSWTGVELPKLTIRAGDEIFATVQPHHLVDHGPFYGRAITDVDVGGSQARGVAEVVYPDRIDRPWQRVFVQQRVDDQTRDADPLLLNWFTGPHRGRWRRLLGRAA
jgi:hypothetical protein